MSSLKLQSDFQSLRENGEFRHISRWLAVSYKKNEQGELRWGWSIPRKVGNAVLRNRLKRWGREYIRAVNDDWDINFIFKAKGKDFYKTLTHEEFNKSIQRVFEVLSKNGR